METHEKASARDVFLRTVAVLGLIAVLLLGAWGIIQLAVAIPGIFGSIGNGISGLWAGGAKKEMVTVSAPASLSSGQTLQVSWKHSNQSGQYSYSLSFACENGLTLKAPLPTGSYQDVKCNTPFNYTNATQSLTVIPSVTGSQSVPLILSVSASKLSTGAVSASGSATTNVAPQAKTTASSSSSKSTKTSTSYSSKPSTTYYAANSRAALYGYGDLATSINSVLPINGREQVSFTIQNVGTNVVASGWTFNAMLPINGSYTFASQPQQALYPGDKIVYVLTFDRPAQYPQPYVYNQYNQYPYNGQYQYNNPYPYNQTAWTGGWYSNCNYGGGTCYNNNQYPNYGYPSNYNYPTYPGYSLGTVTITADPYGSLYELNKGNNTASAPIN